MAVGMAGGSSPRGVAGSEVGWLVVALSLVFRCSSSSSRISPSTRRTMLPMTSSFGLALTSRLPTSRTLSSNLAVSEARPAAMTRRRRKAVARAQGFEPEIWRRLTREIKYSIDVSTFSLDTVRMNEARPGVASAVRAMLATRFRCVHESFDSYG
jgi:hypothetical protein